MKIPTRRNLRTRRALAVLRKFIQALIVERKMDRHNRGDLLSMLLLIRDDEGKPMSDEQVFDEVITICGAGHETCADALCWCLYLLARNPEIYNRLQKEVDAVLSDHSPTYADLTNLPYTLQVFKETLRLYPPAAVMMREASRNTELGNYMIRKGDIILIAPYIMHRQSAIFPDPEKFDPERFKPENERNLPPCAYLPFGFGQRFCIGKNFALMESQLILATLTRKVTFELISEEQAQPQLLINLRPKGGLKVQVRRRNGTSNE